MKKVYYVGGEALPESKAEPEEQPPLHPWHPPRHIPAPQADIFQIWTGRCYSFIHAECTNRERIELHHRALDQSGTTSLEKQKLWQIWLILFMHKNMGQLCFTLFTNVWFLGQVGPLELEWVLQDLHWEPAEEVQAGHQVVQGGKGEAVWWEQPLQKKPHKTQPRL